jgi:hypothetical protein
MLSGRVARSAAAGTNFCTQSGIAAPTGDSNVTSAEIEAKFGSDLGDDPVFGRMQAHEEFFEASLVAAERSKAIQREAGS